MTLQVLHVTQQWSLGGAGRVLLDTAERLRANGVCSSRVMSLVPASDAAAEAAARTIPVIDAPSTDVARDEIVRADVVHVHFWNTPELFEWLRDCVDPARIVLWSVVGGDSAPHILSRALLDFADITLVSCAYSCELPVFRGLDSTFRRDRTAMVPASRDLTFLDGIRRVPHDTFNVGYVGTVDVAKMHPNFVALSARIDVPYVRFVVCGRGNGFRAIRRQAERLGVADRFVLLGFVPDLREALATFDVFGYPLGPENYSSAELVLHEAMYAGIPPVILRRGGAQSTVIHAETGLVVDTDDEYVDAIAHLYHHPEQRARLGANAARYARALFGVERTADGWTAAYDRVMRRPKRSRSLDVNGRGAALFVDAVAGAAPEFSVSLRSRDDDALIEADATIACAPAVVTSAASGGVLHYRRRFPDDPMLRLWSGLVLAHSGHPALAVAEFAAAIDRGCGHWRASWYLAQAARRASAFDLARDALQRVIHAAPQFQPARDLLASMAACA